jgi:hypothetical protein
MNRQPARVMAFCRSVSLWRAREVFRDAHPSTSTASSSAGHAASIR